MSKQSSLFVLKLSEGLWLGFTQTEPAQDNCCAGCSGALWCLVVWLLGHLHRMLKSSPEAASTVRPSCHIDCEWHGKS